jgi:enoyl-CoA hydratase/carnithine racemase
MSSARVERAGGVARLTLCQSRMRNALAPELLTALAQLRDDAECRVVLRAAERLL